MSSQAERRQRTGVARRAALIAIVATAVLAVAVVVAVAAGSSKHPAGTASAAGVPGGRTALPAPHVEHVTRYGGLPSWLPKSSVADARTLSASAAKPAVSLEGEPVEVRLAGGTVLATGVGPEVPRTGLTPPPETTPCTFIVTLAHATEKIPISASSFLTIDDSGHLHRLRLTGVNGAPAPRSVAPGQSVSFALHAVLPTGDGALRWAPEGGRPLAFWDFTVEID
jgi:hypothetical protein